MNIIIIEDEKPAARLLQRKVEKLGLKVTKMLHSVEESIAWFQNNSHPDLIFLDIQLSDGLKLNYLNKLTLKVRLFLLLLMTNMRCVPLN